MRWIIRILLAPVVLVINLATWICVGLISCTSFVFQIASGILSLLAVCVLITYSVKNGLILLLLAFLISPHGATNAGRAFADGTTIHILCHTQYVNTEEYKISVDIFSDTPYNNSDE